MNAEDLTEIERAGRRCAICRSGRHWRQLEVVRVPGREPIVLCAACHARHPTGPELPEPPVSEVAAAVAAVQEPAEEAPVSKQSQRERRAEHEDRLKKALRELPRGEHSTGRIAKAAGLNHSKTLGRLHKLKAAGEVHQVGKLWTIEPPASGLEAAFDRLQAQTSNLRIIRERPPAA